MTNDILDDFAYEETNRTPRSLVVLSVFSFIWNGIMLLVFIVSFIKNLNEIVNFAYFIGKIIGLLLISSISIFNIIGVIKMLILKRAGYYIFLVTQLIYLGIFSVLIFSINHITVNEIINKQLSVMNYVFTGIISFLILTLVLYSIFIKKLKKKTT
jgi:hypothetical protein